MEELVSSEAYISIPGSGPEFTVIDSPEEQYLFFSTLMANTYTQLYLHGALVRLIHPTNNMRYRW